MRDETNRMVGEAFDLLGPRLKAVLDGRPAEEQIEALLKLSCSLACTSTALHRQTHPSSGDFYQAAGRMAAAILVDLLPAPRGEDYKVTYGDGVEKSMQADPEAAVAIKGMLADVRQALDGVATGRFGSVEEAMESIGAVLMDSTDDDKGTLQ